MSLSCQSPAGRGPGNSPPAPAGERRRQGGGRSVVLLLALTACTGAPLDTWEADLGRSCAQCPGAAPLATMQHGVCEGLRQVCDRARCAWREPGYASVQGFAMSDTVCDGLDNDCDGETDEDYESLACGVGACGATSACVQGREQRCSPREPRVRDDDCDGLDDDCDGETDEHFVANEDCGLGYCRTHNQPARCVAGVVWACRPAEPLADLDLLCDGVDEDCDGAADEDFQGSRVCGQGECQRTERCERGVPVCAPGPAETEVCNGLDDDCDGSTDEELVAPPAQQQLGVCAGSVQRCLGEQGWAEPDLAALPGWAPTDDCDGLDNDCDGVTDEETEGAGQPCGSDVGECRAGLRGCDRGTPVCAGEVVPAPERCNGLDDDCDGVTDEGAEGVGQVCGQQQGRCRQGVLTCEEGALLCQGELPPLEEVCNATDDDCDGATDETFPEEGQACGQTGGQCRSGVLECAEGELVCSGAVAPEAERCDDLDHDCDGESYNGWDASDPDSDGVAACADVCPDVSDGDQIDSDHDGLGDACDNCPAVPNPEQRDPDGDGIGDACSPNGGAPPCPQEVAVRVGDQRVELTWQSVEADDLAGYRVTRASGGAQALPLHHGLLLPMPGPEQTFTDNTAVNGVRYAYRIEAVDVGANISPGCADYGAEPNALAEIWVQAPVEAPGPDDPPPDGTRERPYPTFAQGLQAALPDLPVTIRALAGVYRERLVLDRPELRVVVEPDAEAVLQGDGDLPPLELTGAGTLASGLQIDAAGAPYGVVLRCPDGCTLRSAQVHNALGRLRASPSLVNGALVDVYEGVGVLAEDSVGVRVEGCTISSVAGAPADPEQLLAHGAGLAAGVVLRRCQQCFVVGSTVRDVLGMLVTESRVASIGAGIRLEDATGCVVDDNVFEGVRGGDTGHCYWRYAPSNALLGGAAVGVDIIGSTGSRLRRNRVAEIQGGQGGSEGNRCCYGNGGPVAGLRLGGGSTDNVVQATEVLGLRPGLPGDETALPGAAWGMWLAADSLSNRLGPSNSVEAQRIHYYSGLSCGDLIDVQASGPIPTTNWGHVVAVGCPGVRIANARVSGLRAPPNAGWGGSATPVPGASAVGIRLIDCPDATLEGCVVDDLEGGPGRRNQRTGWGASEGGAAVGMLLEQSPRATLQGNRWRDLRGGPGGLRLGDGSGGHGGLAVGLWLQDAPLAELANNQSSGLLPGVPGASTPGPSGNAGTSYGIYFATEDDQRAYIDPATNLVEGASVVHLWAPEPGIEVADWVLDQPVATTNVARMAIIGGEDITIRGNHISNVIGAPGGTSAPGGKATGLLVRSCTRCMITGNHIEDVWGGVGGPGGPGGAGGHLGANNGSPRGGLGGAAYGMELVQLNESLVDANTVHDVRSGDGGQGGDNHMEGRQARRSVGGLAAGIHLAASTGNTLSDNRLTRVRWGEGNVPAENLPADGSPLPGYGLFLEPDSLANQVLPGNTVDGQELMYRWGLRGVEIVAAQTMRGALATNLGQIALVDCADVTVRGLQVESVLAPPLHEGVGVHLQGCQRCVLEGARISEVRGGVGLAAHGAYDDGEPGADAVALRVVDSPGLVAVGLHVDAVGGGAGGNAYGPNRSPGRRGAAAGVLVEGGPAQDPPAEPADAAALRHVLVSGVHGSDAAGLRASGAAAVELDRSTLHNAQGAASAALVHAASGSAVVVRDSIVAASSGAGFSAEEDASVTASRCAAWDVAVPTEGPVEVDALLEADPLFTTPDPADGPLDLHLLPDSPCIDAGDPETGCGDEPACGDVCLPDIGAYAGTAEAGCRP